MTVITKGPRTAAHVLSEASGSRSREAIVINATAGKLAAGTVLAKITSANAASATADSGNTGNGTIGTITVANTAITGNYVLTITAEGANAGTFALVDPLGAQVGTGTVGAAFSGGGLSFTLADGTSDWDVDDFITIAVNAGLGEWVAYDDDGTNDGRRAATGVLYESVDATESDAHAVAHVRDCELSEAELTGLDAAGKADLLALGVIVR